MPEIPANAIERLVKYLAKRQVAARESKLAELYRKLGPETLYRHEVRGATLNRVGEGERYHGDLDDHMLADEPRGMYFGSSLEDTERLIMPQDSREEATAFGRARGAVKDLTARYSPGAVQPSREEIEKEFIRARLLPKAKVLDVGDPEDYNKLLVDFHKTTKHLKDEERTNQALGEKLSEFIRKKGYDAVTLPDVGAPDEFELDMPQPKQTVLLKKGAAIGRIGKYYRILGLLAALDKLQNSSGDDS